MAVLRREAEARILLRNVRIQRRIYGQKIGQRVKRRVLAGKQRLQNSDQQRDPPLRFRRGRTVFRVGKQVGIGCPQPAFLRRRGAVRQFRRKALRRLRQEAGAVKFRPGKQCAKPFRRQPCGDVISEAFRRKAHGSRSFFWYLSYYNEESGAVQQKNSVVLRRSAKNQNSVLTKK